MYRLLYQKRRDIRPEIFRNNYKMANMQMSSICSGNSDEGVFVCYRDGKLVGFMVFENIVDKAQAGVEYTYNIYVRDLFVLEEYRRLGIATRLFREVCRYADKCRFKSVRFRNWGFDKDVEKFINSLNKKILQTTYEIEL
jgi:GNAT superfamily N-acetyltransferase